MPYSKDHKQKTRLKILENAFRLFSLKGFNAVTLDDVMHASELTRGGFYAHFKSKAELYREALTYSASHSELTRKKPEAISDKAWLSELLDQYLCLEHARGRRPCPLAFLVTDASTRNQSTGQAYTNSFKAMNQVLQRYLGDNGEDAKQSVLAATSMMIGAVAVSRTVIDDDLASEILLSSRQTVGQLLGGA